MSGLRVKGKCIIVIIDCGSYTTGVLIWHEGGIYDGDSNIWEIEVSEFAANIEDIFCDYGYPDKPGFHVWEGEIEPIFQDVPQYYGEWKPATKEDMAVLIK